MIPEIRANDANAAGGIPPLDADCQQTGKRVCVKLTAIQFDHSTQCRIGTDPAIVSQYAEDKRNGDQFPPAELYGTMACCWIGDGWHRLQADQKNGAKEIEAILHPGERLDALRHALKANATHGKPRSQADKRRAVELALKEFPKLSSRQLGKLCSVSHNLVESVRATGINASSVRIGADGKLRATGINASSETQPFDFDCVQTKLREAFKNLFAKCPADRRQDLGVMVQALVEEVQR